jgi:hypothetical protein
LGGAKDAENGDTAATAAIPVRFNNARLFMNYMILFLIALPAKPFPLFSFCRAKLSALYLCDKYALYSNLLTKKILLLIISA